MLRSIGQRPAAFFDSVLVDSSADLRSAVGELRIPLGSVSLRHSLGNAALSAPKRTAEGGGQRP